MESLIVKDSRIDFGKYPLPKDAHRVRDAAEFRTRVKDRLFSPKEKGATPLPWSKFRDDFELRSGELTIWAGINGHGKSSVTGFVGMHQSRFSKVCFASLEMAPEITLQRMINQAAATDDPSLRAVDRFFDWAHGRLYLYDNQRSVDHQHMLGVINYVRHEYGVEHFFIDSLMKCDRKNASKDVKALAQVDFVDELATYAHASGMHIHLIHHMRKGESEMRMPDKFDVRGSSEIVDLADNVVIVFADKRPDDKRNEDDADVYLKIAKQRNAPYEGTKKFWLHKSMRLLEWPNAGARAFDELVQSSMVSGA